MYQIICQSENKTFLLKTLIENFVLFKGCLRVDFYDQKQKYLFSKIIKEKDIIMLVNGDSFGKNLFASSISKKKLMSE